MRVATWNVNSIRARLERVLSWIDRTQPDVVCLQETKVIDDDFPEDPFRERGYELALFGQKTYNGVAILSRLPLSEVRRGLNGESEARFLQARCGKQLVVCSVYVPNGGSVGSEAWHYKLAWLDRLCAYLAMQASSEALWLLAGDFNVAPEARDVAFPEAWADSVLFHEDVRKAFRRLLDWGLVDLIRQHYEGPGPYTWWDYRGLAFPKGDGLRIDHLLATPPLAALCTAAGVHREERKGPKPSDHAPVWAEFQGL
ncbi:exodeoxyribonuclease III [Rhodothermus bifroesti]|jgi:exodeoxyribonuclease-3|uniref:Exodeoxyribonuclease III n=1 Tax=Rhodothermus marinus TaxID=29549 RepID=A0A7V2F700_RHOMR|nr:exodeoxyribonuclease III [Rhodothermus bifroesti]GBD02082.1 Exodeoxyribonuclease III [bacterium HR18]